MDKNTFKILRCEHLKILKVCLAIFYYYSWKGWFQLIYGKNSKLTLFISFHVNWNNQRRKYSYKLLIDSCSAFTRRIYTIKNGKCNSIFSPLKKKKIGKSLLVNNWLHYEFSLKNFLSKSPDKRLLKKPCTCI